MAIGKLVGGNGFKGCARYIMQKADAEHITQRNVFGVTPDEIAREMRLNANQKNIKKPVLHASLSLPPGEHATNEQLQVLGETWLREMGFDIEKTQYVITKHNDTDHEHIHILANRVQLDGKVLTDSNERWRSKDATRVAELAAGVTLYNEHTGDITPQERKGQIAVVRLVVDTAVEQSHGDYKKFVALLASAGIAVKENRQTTGRLAGLTFEPQGAAPIKASALGKDYSAAALRKRGLDVDQQPQRGAGLRAFLPADYALNHDLDYSAAHIEYRDAQRDRRINADEHWRDDLRELVEKAAEYATRHGTLDEVDDTLQRFEADLAAGNVKLHVYTHADGTGRGVGFSWRGKFITGSELGVSGVDLQKRGIDVGIDLRSFTRGFYEKLSRDTERQLAAELAAIRAAMSGDSDVWSLSGGEDVAGLLKFRVVKALSQGQKDRARARGHQR